jgi:hypothetical protein
MGLLASVGTLTVGLPSPQSAFGAEAISPNSFDIRPGAPITFTVAWGANDLRGSIVIQPRTGGLLGGCVIAVQPGTTTSCVLASGLPAGSYLWWIDYVEKNCINEYCFELARRSTGVFRVWAPSLPPPPPSPLHPPPTPQIPLPLPRGRSIDAASNLPSSDRFDGSRSVKHTQLSQLVYKTMKLVTRTPRLLAIACWTEDDFASVLGGVRTDRGRAVTLAFWNSGQPRWLHLSESACLNFEELLYQPRLTGRRAYSLVTVLHEAAHAYGIVSEAQANCYAVQLVPDAVNELGFAPSQAIHLGKLALNYTRRTAPPGYWNATRCRDGGAWDLVAERKNL